MSAETKKIRIKYFSILYKMCIGRSQSRCDTWVVQRLRHNERNKEQGIKHKELGCGRRRRERVFLPPSSTSQFLMFNSLFLIPLIVSEPLHYPSVTPGLTSTYAHFVENRKIFDTYFFCFGRHDVLRDENRG